MVLEPGRFGGKRDRMAAKGGERGRQELKESGGIIGGNALNPSFAQQNKGVFAGVIFRRNIAGKESVHPEPFGGETGLIEKLDCLDPGITGFSSLVPRAFCYCGSAATVEGRE